MVRVDCETDFGAKSESFINLTKKIAKTACGYQVDNPEELLDLAWHEELVLEIKSIEDKIKEKITIRNIKLMTLS